MTEESVNDWVSCQGTALRATKPTVRVHTRMTCRKQYLGSTGSQTHTCGPPKPWHFSYLCTIQTSYKSEEGVGSTGFRPRSPLCKPPHMARPRASSPSALPVPAAPRPLTQNPCQALCSGEQPAPLQQASANRAEIRQLQTRSPRGLTQLSPATFTSQSTHSPAWD